VVSKSNWKNYRKALKGLGDTNMESVTMD